MPEWVVYTMYAEYMHMSWDESGTDSGSVYLSAAICIRFLLLFISTI